MLNAAYDLDDDDSTPLARKLRTIAREATDHGHHARIARDHVLVTSPEGATLATRSATRLAHWLGY